MKSAEITIPNKNKNPRLVTSHPLIISQSNFIKFAPIIITHITTINIKRVKIPIEFAFSKNPPGYVVIIIVTIIIKIKNRILLKYEKFVKLLRKFVAPTPTLLGIVKRSKTYNKPKITKTIVNINEGPKYLVIYPPGLKLYNKITITIKKNSNNRDFILS